MTISSFRDDKAHGLTFNKVVAFAAIPDVLAKGKIIDIWQPNGKQYSRITVAAPISISGEKYYMGVMIQRDNQSQRMYLHDVITEKATLSFTTEPTADLGEGIRDKSHLFITSILQNALNVNRQNKNKSGKSQFSLSPSERNFNYNTEDEDLWSRIKAKTRNLNPPTEEKAKTENRKQKQNYRRSFCSSFLNSSKVAYRSAIASNSRRWFKNVDLSCLDFPFPGVRLPPFLI